jgi:hypothetical protein
MPDKNLIERIAGALGTRPGLIEKDWHVVRALGLLATLEHQDIRPVFSGGTSLASLAAERNTGSDPGRTREE